MAAAEILDGYVNAATACILLCNEAYYPGVFQRFYPHYIFKTKKNRMKQLIFALCLVITATTVQAQPGYDFSYKTGQPYTPLSSGTNISAGIVWEFENWTIDMPFSFGLGGSSINKFHIFFNSMMPASDTEGVLSTFIPFGVISMMDRGNGTGTALSPIRHTIEGAAPSRVFKLEYWNAGVRSLDGPFIPTDSLNLQVWVYETSGVVEFHYGDSYFADPAQVFDGDGPIVAYIRDFDIDNDTFAKAYTLKGNPEAPVIDSVDYTDDPFLLDAMPAKGTVYRFAPKKEGSSVGEKELLSRFSVYPTKTAGNLYVRNSYDLKGRMELFSVTGQQVAGSTILTPGINELDLSSLPAAMYLLQITTTQGRVVYRFTKE